MCHEAAWIYQHAYIKALPKVIERFKAFGCDPNLTNPGGRTAAEEALANGHAKTAALLARAYGAGNEC
jgi:ankyrin repeat protein